ncbi:MAG: glycoside hydrolase family 2 TIM barrel-domain containing protein [Bacteroidota bacterium]|nr:glycoside hydrolase family 2 TIM barrel-domain containing protein [Bacteroidota bacterium]
MLWSVDDSTQPYIDLCGAWTLWSDTSSKSRRPSQRTVYVPSNWYIQGLDTAGLIILERHFYLPRISSDTLLCLVFEGVDYAAEVYLNNTLLGKHTGYFQSFAFDVSHAARYGQHNTLRVYVYSPRECPEDWSLHKRYIKGIFGHHDTRPGGAWSPQGQDANTGGIWGKVYITASHKVVLPHIRITPLPADIHALTTGNGAQTVRIVLQTSVWARTPQRIALHYTVRYRDSIVTDKQSIVRLIPSGLSTVVDTLRIHKPLLWYTYDVGIPHRYTLETRVYELQHDTLPRCLLRSGCSQLSRFNTFGIRSIQYDTTTGIWFLNGKRLFLRGTNYIATQYLSTMTRALYDRDAALMRSAHINAVRVHAHIARKEWYDACDSLGILLWQDFPLQWGYTDDALFVQDAVQQLRDMLALLSHHPSIAVWCMHNEPPFDAEWMQYKYPNYHPLQNRPLNCILTRLARSIDSTRYVHPFSATREHRWEGWYFGHWTDYGRPTQERLITEFGAQGLPHRQTMHMILGEQSDLPSTDSAWARWEYHNFQRHETFSIARIPQGKSLDEFIQNSQEHQRRVLELAAESYRLQRYSPVGAIFHFMFVEAWASMNWGIVDYRRIPKPAYYALAEAYQPILIATTLDSAVGNLHIHLVNDSWHRMPEVYLNYRVEPLHTNRSVVRLQNTVCSTLAADTIQHISSVRLPSYGTYHFHAILTTRNGDTLSTRNKVLYYNSTSQRL